MLEGRMFVYLIRVGLESQELLRISRNYAFDKEK